MTITIVVSYDYPDGSGDVSFHYVASNPYKINLSMYREVVKEYPDRIVEVIQTPNNWTGKHTLFWDNKDPHIKTLASTNNDKRIKFNFNVLVQTSDHEDGHCSGNENEYDEYKEFIDYELFDFNELNINDDDDLFELKNLNVGNNIPSHLFEYFELEDLVRKPTNDNNGSYYCDITDECVQYGLGKHDYRITILSGKLISK